MQPRSRSDGIRPLESLNFFMADMQAGIGPFLGVFLLAHGWESGRTGSIMTIGGVAGLLMTAPAGALVDATSRKRYSVIVPGLQSVAVPGLVARILNGTERVNVGQGAVMTVQGLGASLSPACAGAADDGQQAITPAGAPA